jgi:hypothetical protein
LQRGLRRPDEENGDLAQRSFIESLNRDLGLNLLQRSLVEISCRHLVQIALRRDLSQQFLHGNCQEDLPHDLVQRSSQRETAEPNLVSQYCHVFATLFGVSCRDDVC